MTCSGTSRIVAQPFRVPARRLAGLTASAKAPASLAEALRAKAEGLRYGSPSPYNVAYAIYRRSGRPHDATGAATRAGDRRAADYSGGVQEAPRREERRRRRHPPCRRLRARAHPGRAAAAARRRDDVAGGVREDRR